MQSLQSTKTGKTRKNSLQYIIGKTLETQNKGKVLKGAREKGQIIYKDRSIIIKPESTTKTFKSLGGWNDTFQLLKDHNCQGTLYTQ